MTMNTGRAARLDAAHPSAGGPTRFLDKSGFLLRGSRSYSTMNA